MQNPKISRKNVDKKHNFLSNCEAEDMKHRLTSHDSLRS